MRYYVAGGTVRDLLLGITPKDHDVVFAAADGADPVQEFIALNPKACKVGARKEIFILDGREYSPLNGPTTACDLERRDFTINAFLLEESGLLHMLPQSVADLAAGRISPASPAAFTLDPLRVFRAARFACTLPDFTPTPECLALMRQAAQDGLLHGLAPERVGAELLRALRSPRPGTFLRVLDAADCLEPWFCEFKDAARIPAGPSQYHAHSVLGHTAEVMDRCAARYANWEGGFADGPPHGPTNGTASGPEADAGFLLPKSDTRTLAVWMALCHDLGKTNTPPDVLPHHYGHEERGREMAEVLALRLALPREYRKAGSLSSRLHMRAGTYDKHRPGVRVDMLSAAHAARMTVPLFLLAEADSGRDDLWRIARAELKTLLAVVLPPKDWNQGEESARRLREMRCLALPGRPADTE